MENAADTDFSNILTQGNINRYRSPGKFYRITFWLLIGAAINSLLNLLYKNFPLFMDRLLNENEVISIAIIAVYVVVICCIPAVIVWFMLWLYRVSANLKSFGEISKISPGLSVGLFFIPIANFATPYIVISGILKKSRGVEKSSRAGLWLAACWWACCLGPCVTVAGDLLYHNLAGFQNDISRPINIVFYTLLFAGSALTILVMRKITNLQDAFFSQMKSSSLLAGQGEPAGTANG
jgi:hypothetical protein